MAICLQKGGNVNLSKETPSLTRILIGLGWDARATEGQPFDLDASVFMVKADGKVPSDAYFIFYNQMKSPEGSVEHGGDNRDGAGEGDDESIKISLSSVPSEIQRLVIAVSIHDAESRKQNFSQISNAFIRIVNQENNEEIACFNLSEDYSTETAMVFGEVYRYGTDWKFRAVGQGYSGGLRALTLQYGVDVSDPGDNTSEAEVTKTKQIRAEAAFSRWIQMRGGELSAEAANRIINGEDFDEVIESCLGDHPDAVESQIPGEYILYESDSIEEIAGILKDFKTDSLTCVADDIPVPFKALIVPLGDAEEAIEEGNEAFVNIEALPTHIGDLAAKVIATLHSEACDKQDRLYKRLFYKRDNDDGPLYLWAFLDDWNGLSLSVEKTVSDDRTPNITFVFFLVSSALPYGDEIVDQDDEAYELIAGQCQYALYMPAIVIGDEVPKLSIEDDSDRGIQRLVIEYRDTVTSIVYDSLATDADKDDDDDDDDDDDEESMSLNDWETKLLDENFTQRRSACSSRSYFFVLIYSKEGGDYDREILGGALLPDKEWSCIDPPGPTFDGFGEIFTRERLKENEGKILLGQLRRIASVESIVDEIFPYLDGLFIANKDVKSFEEILHNPDRLATLIQSGSDDDCVEIVEYEPQ